MPAGQPFTTLCQQIATLAANGRADLHVHTTASDGEYEPHQVVEVAARSGLSAVGITDHDTMAGVAPARKAAGSRIDVISGVEITAEECGREVHLLGYFVREDDGALTEALGRLRCQRKQRFLEMAERLRGCGAPIAPEILDSVCGRESLGRRNLATMLCQSGQVGSVREAFDRYLADGGPADVPKARLPLDDAIALVRGAGGVTSLAHPSEALTFAQLKGLRERGLQAVEANYPTQRSARSRELRDWAGKLGMAISGGSDCHGPDQPQRGIGCRGVTAEELNALRNCIV